MDFLSIAFRASLIIQLWCSTSSQFMPQMPMMPQMPQMPHMPQMPMGQMPMGQQMPMGPMSMMPPMPMGMPQAMPMAIPMHMSQPKLPVVVMPFRSKSADKNQPNKRKHKNQSSKHKKRNKKKKEKSKSSRSSESSSGSSSETDSSSSSSFEFRSGKKGGRSIGKRRQVLTPVISYVTKSGRVVYQKKIKTDKVKDWNLWKDEGQTEGNADNGQIQDSGEMSIQEFKEKYKRAKKKRKHMH